MNAECCHHCQRPLNVTAVCRDCGRTFTIAPDQQAFFYRRGLNLPRRCDYCRRQRRLNDHPPAQARAHEELTKYAGPNER